MINRGWAVPLLVLFIVFVNSALVELITESITNNQSFYQDHYGAVAIALLVSALICWQLGRKLNRARAVTFGGRKQRREYVSRPSHLRSSISIEHWAFLLVIVAGFLLLQAFLA